MKKFNHAPINFARKELLKEINSIKTFEEIDLIESLNRFLAKDYLSRFNLPQTDNSAVDGYGINFSFFKNNPKHLFTVDGEAKAGHPLNKSIDLGKAVRIFTGAIVPKGIDLIIMQENCSLVKEGIKIKKNIVNKIRLNLNIRKAGENIHKGEKLVTKGTKICSQHIGQLAAAGYNKIRVMKKLIVGIISTGDEIIRNKKVLNKGEIFDSNAPMISALCKSDNLEIRDFGVVKDNEELLIRNLKNAISTTDLVILSGGASEGVEDHTLKAISKIRANLVLNKLAIKPGRPMSIAIKGKKPIFCLPGNPVAVFVCYKLLVSKLIEKYGGGNISEPFIIKLSSGFYHSKKKGRTEYLRAKIETINNEGKQQIILHGRKGAGVISSLIDADGLAEIPSELTAIKPGMKINFIPFGEIGI